MSVEPETREQAARPGARRGVSRVEGESMLPTLRPGDEVVVDLERRDFRVGDLVLLRGADGLVVHRVIRTGDHYETRGDNSSLLDGAVPAEHFVGRVALVHREGRWIDHRRLGRRAANRLLGRISRLALGRPRVQRGFQRLARWLA